ncbi:molybdopterin molybdotransferase MoeA [candidate division KSB1 bacterium]|nr:molybdopterin molybdotransferase MoeA [candidate division KSB1 bacterium]
MDLISIQEAVKIIQQNIPPIQTDALTLELTSGLVVAQDVLAREASPLFTNSAMDGFAVKWSDVSKTGEKMSVTLHIIGESIAGLPFRQHVETGQAVQINTGAVLPDGTDTVIPVEHTVQNNDRVVITRITRKGQFIRPAGAEFESGAVLCKTGTILTPGCLGLLASQGILSIKVILPPRVSLVVTGSELIPHDLKPEPGQIRDANTIMLSSMIHASNAKNVFHTRTDDNINAVRQGINKAADVSDLVIVSGGVSMGPHDLVKPAAQDAGFKKLFWGVRQKPGKPLYVAKKDNTLLFGLPGNMVSALNSFAFYIHPILRQMAGKTFEHKKVKAVLSKSFTNEENRTVYLRVQLLTQNNKTVARPFAKQDSHMLTSIDQAHGFILVEPGQTIVQNNKVTVTLYPWDL